jgi:hypothetical protein
LSRSRSASKDDHLRISADRASAGELSVEIRDPVIFAFEISEASFITSHLGVEPSDVQFRPVRPADLPPESRASKSTRVPWILSTIASGHYPALQTLRQDWNAASASLMQKTLGEYAPIKVDTLAATEEKPLSELAIKTFMADLSKDTRDNGHPLVIGYYVGHVVTWPSGDIALILGNAASIPRFPPAVSKAATDEGLGKNIGNLARLADALSANVEKLPEGFLPLRELYSGFEQLGVRFALIIDGCLRMDEFERSREALHIVLDRSGTSFFYVGPDGEQTSALSQLGTLLTHVADNQPFLHTANPVVLAAKPGTYAFAAANPDLTWGEVGPMAARITNFFRASRFDADRPTLADLIERVVDFRGTGEISPKGSISWSDFSRFRTSAQAIPYPGY